MKKIISLILCVAVLSVVLSGCSEPYTYKTVRVKKTGEEHTSEAHKSDNLTIITEGRYIIILDKKAGIKYRVKP